MPNYRCPRCLFTTDRYKKMERHINRKNKFYLKNFLKLEIFKYQLYLITHKNFKLLNILINI